MDRNLEIKARLTDPAATRQAAERIADRMVGVLEQRDTYFHCRNGRLKLREMPPGAELIWYARPDDTQVKGSDYCRTPVPDPGALLQTLSTALGIRGVVQKRRTLLLQANVRIHLDEVAGLGDFLELEAVIASSESGTVHAEKMVHAELVHAETAHGEEESRRRLTAIMDALGISPGMLVAGSYADLFGF